jgi:excisionase family DNA binding protein
MHEDIQAQLSRIESLLTQQTALQKEVLNFKEAVNYMGVSPSYLYKLTSSRKIEHFCPEGKMLFFNRISLDQWLQRNRLASITEIEQEAIENAKNCRRK